ncbi:unnamed protein product, partial [Meganyctiphanes norvegica]
SGRKLHLTGIRMELGNSTTELVGQERAGIRTMLKNRTRLEKGLAVVSAVTLLACAALVAVVATTGSPAQEVKTLIIEPSVISPSAPVDKILSNEKIPVPETPKQKSYRLPVYRSKLEDGTQEDICSTPECVLAAADFIQAMDTSFDPCDNFYKFACNGWKDKHPIPETSSRWSQFNVLDVELSNALSTILQETINEDDPLPLNQAKRFFNGCMNETQLESHGVVPLSQMLTTLFGGWPMADNTWQGDAFSWTEVTAHGREILGDDYFINVWVFADQKDTFKTAIYIDQTSLSMPRSVLISPDSYKERFEAYKTYIKTTATILAESLGQEVDTDMLDADVEAMVDFEMSLANITTPSEERRDADRMYNPMTVSELSVLTDDSNLDWQHYLTDVFSSAGITIDDNTRVIVQERQYLHLLTKLIEQTDSRVIANYLNWRHVKSLGDETNQAMRDASFQYQMVASGVTAPEPRWQQCSNKANNLLGFALGTKYIDGYFSQQAKDEANEMVEDIRSAFEDILDVNEWMDEETKPKAVEKAEAISKFIAYPDWYGNNSALEHFYAGLDGISEIDHFNNEMVLRSWTSEGELDDFGNPTDRTQWWGPPTIVNAWYMPEFNSITFPAGILQPPFYRANSLQALNYGGIGQVIGHEITHGFDDQGRQNDKDGNAIPWWNNATLDAFKVKAQCIIDQYTNYKVPEIDEYIPDAHLNGINTQGENIADNGGIREAYMAYQKYIERNGPEPRLPGLEQYSPEQLFFLSNANIWCGAITKEGLLNQVLTDPHSPSDFRVIGPMSNMEEFSQLWSCPAGSPMNRDNKCVVW